MTVAGAAKRGAAKRSGRAERSGERSEVRWVERGAAKRSGRAEQSGGAASGLRPGFSDPDGVREGRRETVTGAVSAAGGDGPAGEERT